MTRTIEEPQIPWVKISDDPPQYTKAAPLPTCETLPSYQRRSALELPAGTRNQLRELLLAESGLIAVALQGCSLTVLPECRVDHPYEYWPPIDRRRHVQIIDQPEELWSNLPVRAEATSGALELTVHDGGSFVAASHTTYDGSLEVVHFRVAELGLRGECEAATHVVAEVFVGVGELRTLDGRVLVEVGERKGCGGGDPRRRAERGCLEPLTLALVPLDARAPYERPCTWPTTWTGVACIAQPDPCMSPEPRHCRGELVTLGSIRPPRLAAARIPCELASPTKDAEILEITVHGPSGQISEVCGSTHEVDERATELFERRLEVSRATEQRFELSCPVKAIELP